MGQRWQWVARLGGLVSLFFALHSPVSAQDDLKTRQRASAELTGQAAIAFNAGELERARDLLLKARAAFANPIIDYNLGRAYEGLDQPSLAVDAYTRYLIAVPDAANAGLVRQRIEVLTASSMHSKAPEVDPSGQGEAPDRASLAAKSQSLSPWPIVLGGIGLATLGVGVGLHLDAQAQADAALETPRDQVQAAQRVESARDQNVLSNVLLVSGAALATAGVVWLVVELTGGQDHGLEAQGSGISLRF